MPDIRQLELTVTGAEGGKGGGGCRRPELAMLEMCTPANTQHTSAHRVPLGSQISQELSLNLLVAN